jgi:glycine cleavage system H protein
MAKIEGYEFPTDRWYDPREHVWVLPEDAVADGTAVVDVRMGIDALGQALLGEVVYLELVEPGREIRRGQVIGSVEAEKMVRPVAAPVSGVVVEVNAAVRTTPRFLNRAPYDAGWLVRIRADRWEAERQDLLFGEAAVTAWARSEIEASRT